MSKDQGREYPVRFVKAGADGEPEMAFDPAFMAWLLDITPEQLKTAYAVHGKIPPELAAKGKAKRARLGTSDMSDAIDAYMRGEA